MTDILVRVPKGETEHFWEVHYGADIEWWTLGRKPTRFKDGDLIFFALGDDVVAFAERTKLVSGRILLNSMDGREWWGEHIVWPVDAFHKLNVPVPLHSIGMKVPRGFGYCGHTRLRRIAGIAEPLCPRCDGSCEEVIPSPHELLTRPCTRCGATGRAHPMSSHG